MQQPSKEKHIGDIVKELLRAYDNKTKLAADLDVSTGSISNWIAKKTMPYGITKTAIKALAEKFDIKLYE